MVSSGVSIWIQSARSAAWAGARTVSTVGARLLGGPALGVKADDDVVAAIAQVLRLGVSLGTVAKNGDGLAFESGGVRILLIEDCGHGRLLRS